MVELCGAEDSDFADGAQLQLVIFFRKLFAKMNSGWIKIQIGVMRVGGY